MASIHCLPNELLMKIFSYLHVSDVSLNVAKVCKQWNELSFDTFLWSQLVFVVEEEASLSSVLNILTHLPHLHSIIVRWRTDSEEIVNSLCRHCKYLEKIHFFCCGYVKKNSVKQISETCKLVRDFSLGKCYSVQNKCFNHIHQMKNLTSLDLSYSVLNSDQFRVISTNCRKIICLNIDYVRGITEEDLILFIEPRKNQLISLIVFGELLTDNIFNLFENCQSLKVLQISTCRRLSEKCFEAITKMECLKSLTLRKLVSISSKSLHNFFFGSCFNQKICFLYISTKRTFTEEELSVWYPNEPMSASQIKLLKNRTSILVIKKEGFSFQMLH